MEVEIEVQWSGGDETLKRTKSTSEILSDARSRDLEVGQVIRLLDDTWRDTRAALIALLSPQVQENFGVILILSKDETERFINWQREKR